MLKWMVCCVILAGLFVIGSLIHSVKGDDLL